MKHEQEMNGRDSFENSSWIHFQFARMSRMNVKSIVYLMGILCGAGLLQAQQGAPRGGGGPRPEQLGENPADLGSAGVVWYPILEDGLAEARRTNKPIMFMAVASQCGGVSGVF